MIDSIRKFESQTEDKYKMEQTMKWTYRLVIEELSPEDGGGLLAYFPTVGRGVAYGCGDTIAELLMSLADGVECYVDYVSRHGIELPEPTAEDDAWHGNVNHTHECERAWIEIAEIRFGAAMNNYAFAA